MIPATAATAIVLAQVFAIFGPDPSWISPVNFSILVYMAVFTRREITTLRRQSVAAAEAAAEASVAAAAASVQAAAELARMAKGSETRAEKAAAEITATKQRVEAAAAEMVIIGNSIRDKLKLIRGEWDRLHEARRELDDTTNTPPRADR